MRRCATTCGDYDPSAHRPPQLALDTPYNTRLHRGLPPTPISNPGLASMMAAMQPGARLLPVLRGQAVHLWQARVRDHLHAVRGRRERLRRGAQRRTAAARRRTARERPARRTVVSASSAGRSPTAARRRCSAPRSRALGLHGWSYQRLPVAAGALRRDRPRPARRRVRRRERDRSRTSTRRSRSPTARAPAARAIGAANTLTFLRDGAIEAENTDAPGLIARARKLDLAGCTAVVLGAGGTARAAVWALRGAGAEVAIWNRTPERAAELAADARCRGGRAPRPADLLVNATTVGMDERLSLEDALITRCAWIPI